MLLRHPADVQAFALGFPSLHSHRCLRHKMPSCTQRRPSESLHHRKHLCPRSFNVQGPGSDAPSADPAQGQINDQLITRMKQSITDALEAQQVDVVDINGDGRHVGIDVIAHAFEGLSSVKRQRLVYKAIWAELMETVHAVDAMTTKTPAEAGQ